MKEIIRHYTNGEVTVVWQPAKCVHSAICFRGLPEVFDPKKRPWVNANGADTARIISQVQRCPSGALSFFLNSIESRSPEPDKEMGVEVVPNGPLVIHGTFRIKLATGEEVENVGARAFCRCGASSNKPYCDGAHDRIGFKG